MLRVCTNVLTKDGKRAIGTLHPGDESRRRAQPRAASRARRPALPGRAFVVDRWYVTAYEPIRDADGAVVGMTYFGVPLESATALRQSIMDVKVGQTGYVYVLDGKGNYVISKDGKRDGENLWEAKDADGTAFIQDIVTKAKALPDGEVGEQIYPWQNPGDDRGARQDRPLRLLRALGLGHRRRLLRRGVQRGRDAVVALLAAHAGHDRHRQPAVAADRRRRVVPGLRSASPGRSGTWPTR